MGLAGRTAERSIGDGDRRRSPPTVRLASAVLVATRVPKAELEEPSVGALARERLTERETRVEAQCPTVGRFAKRDCEGRAGSPADPVHRVYRNGRRDTGPILGGREDQRDCSNAMR